MKFIVKQAVPEAPEEKPVELSLSSPDCDGWVTVMANGREILRFAPDGTAVSMFMPDSVRDLGFVADSDGRLKIRHRKPI